MLKLLVSVGYLVLGFVQFLAVMAAIEMWTGWHWIIVGPISLFFAYLPVIGSIVGVVGAHSAWGWSWLQSLALFFGPLIAMFILSGVASAMEHRAR